MKMIFSSFAVGLCSLVSLASVSAQDPLPAGAPIPQSRPAVVQNLVSPVFSPADAAAPSSAAERVEYKILHINMQVLMRSPKEMEQQLNLWGSKGWKVAQTLVSDEEEQAMVILVRPLS